MRGVAVHGWNSVWKGTKRAKRVQTAAIEIESSLTICITNKQTNNWNVQYLQTTTILLKRPGAHKARIRVFSAQRGANIVESRRANVEHFCFFRHLQQHARSLSFRVHAHHRSVRSHQQTVGAFQQTHKHDIISLFVFLLWLGSDDDDAKTESALRRVRHFHAPHKMPAPKIPNLNIEKEAHNK
jgi:hypothetical protein